MPIDVLRHLAAPHAYRARRRKLVAGSYLLYRRWLIDEGTFGGVFESGPRGELAREVRAQ
jgi:hypothetical protein